MFWKPEFWNIFIQPLCSYLLVWAFMSQIFIYPCLPPETTKPDYRLGEIML